MPSPLRKVRIVYNSLSLLGSSRLTIRLLRNIRYRFIYPHLGQLIYHKTFDCFDAPPITLSSTSFLSPSTTRETIFRKATAFSQRTFTFLNLPLVTFSQNIDWQYAPNQDPLWQYCLHYGEWALDLAQAFLLTKEERYRQASIRLMDDWIDHNPPGSTPGWEPYPLARRLVAWSKVALALWQDENWSSFWKKVLAPSLYQQTLLLGRNLEKDLANNHLLANYRALSWVGLLFPDWPGAKKRRDFGLGSLWEEMDRQVLPDGVHDERSVSYHAIVLKDLLETWNLCKILGIEVPSNLEEKFSMMLQFLKDIQAPDGSYPMINDTVPGYPEDLQVVPMQVKTCLKGWRKLAGKCESIRLNNRAQNASVTAYPHAGYVILRGKSGDFLCFDAGPMGPDHLPGHGHADALSFVLYNSQKPIIIDPGVYSYHDRPWRDHFRSTKAHNTVSIDGQDQCFFWGAFRVAFPPRVRLLSWSDQHVAGEHEGYLRLKDPVCHQRQIKRKGQGLWELFDRFIGSGEHEFILSLQLAPGAKLEQKSITDYIAHWPEVSLEISVIQPWPGSRACIEMGWVSPSWNLKVEAPKYTLHWRATVPVENRILLRITE